MRCVCLCIAFVWLFCVRSSPIHAQTETKHFRNTSINRGLSQNTVFAVIQDTLGFVWMATQDGLNRFDSKKIAIYRRSDDPSSIRSTYIKSLFLDRKGNLWIGGNGGVSRYQHAENNFINYHIPRSSGDWYIAGLTEDDRGNIWAAANTGELFYLPVDGKLFNAIKLNTPLYGIRNVTTLNFVDGKFLVGTDIGLFELDTETQKLTRVDLPVEKPAINTVFKDGKLLWIGTEGSGLIAFDTKDGTTKHFVHEKNQPYSLADNDVRGIEKDGQGNLWIGTFRGLSILPTKAEIFQNFYHQASIPYTISQNSVRCIYRDRQNGMWLGTFYGGINYYHESDIKFNLISQNTGRLSLNDQVINVIREDASGNFWIGTNDGGLNYWDRNANTMRYYTHVESKLGTLSSNNIKAITFDNQGNLLLGTHNAGLNLFNPTTGKAIAFNHREEDPKSITGDMVYALLKDHKDRIWVGTRSGLDQFQPKDQSFTHFYVDKMGKRLSSDEITYLREDSKNRIWVGTTNGVNIFYPDNLIFDPLPDSDLSNDVVNCIIEDRKGRIWVGTRDGLNLYDEHSRRFLTPDRQKDLLKGAINSMQCDRAGDLWVATNAGLVRFNPDSHKWQLFDSRDGLQDNQFNLYASCGTDDGMLLFGGINGISYFYPNTIKPKSLNLHVFFTGVEVFNRAVKPEEGSAILDRHIDQEEKIVLAHEHREFSILFNSFNFVSTRRTKYQYRLAGYDKGWQEADDMPSASYANLPPGDYTFYVQAIGPMGERSEIRHLTVVIFPPWYRSNWFYFGALLLLGGMSYLVYRVVSERIKTLQQLKIERLEKEQVTYINQVKMDFFTNVSHELRTPLTLILAPLEELLRKPIADRLLKRQLELIGVNAKRLYHLVGQLFEFKKTEAGTRRLRVRKGDLVSFIHEIYTSFKPLAEKNNIQYHYFSAEARLAFPFDEDAMEKILFNLLSNAFKYTKPDNTVKIELTKDEDDVIIQVIDTGIGIDKEHLEKIFERFYQISSSEMNLGSGVGLAFTKRLVELHHGSIHVNSVVGKGSIFTLRIPTAEAIYEQDLRVEARLYDLTIQRAEAIEDGLGAINSMDGAHEKEHVDKSSKLKLLIVDDQEEIASYLADYFQDHYETIIAHDGKVALNLLEREAIDAVISDVMMPELDGLHLCKRIKQNIYTSHIPVLLLTAKVEVDQQVKGLEMGADDYITKPFSIALLDAKLHNILRTRKRLKEYYMASKEVIPEHIAFNTLDERFLKESMAIIEKYLSDSDFSVDKFSREIGMSRSNLYLKLKAITGESVTDFIKRIRFQKAGVLIATRAYTIAQIAYMTGFNSPSYFSTAFKQYYGCMPSEYLDKKNMEE